VRRSKSRTKACDAIPVFRLVPAEDGLQQIRLRHSHGGAVLAEIFASVNGVGMFILANARGLRQNEAVVGVLILAAFGLLFGLLFEWLMNWVLRHYFPWYQRDDQRGE
jgi:high-affinity Fe2+/Pb2+ permease